MHLQKKRIMSFALILLFIISGCSLNEQPQRLIQQPRLSETNTRMLKFVNQTVPEHAQLIAPIQSNYKGKVMVVKPEVFGRRTALFFYVIENHIHFVAIAQYKDKWRKIYDEEMNASSISKVAITALGHHEEAEIFIARESVPQNQLNVYTVKHGRLIKQLSSPFASMATGVWGNNNQLLELAVFRPIQASQNIGMDLYQFSKQNVPVLIQRENRSAQMMHFEKWMMNQRGAHSNDGITIQNQWFDSRNPLFKGKELVFGTTTSVVRWRDPTWIPKGVYLHARIPLRWNPFTQNTLTRSQIPIVERYYDSLKRFFIDLPVGAAMKINSVKLSGDHVQFIGKNGSTYLEVFRFKRTNWLTRNKSRWEKIGASRNYVFAVPREYRDVASGVIAGAYHE
ncbi:hypothetical protein ACFP7A_06555 [Sporolactobacillus kofuensis]|uniref:Lipoprotein n=1 Tax=Sporolactobacillus kofuensis TaxID=269672 RepID=A0ABW1WGE6_9BACL|nr:hypothetical protein [Sporolactobacillus kofuensis]MCO7175433.1 hypothetical protein [Sporolactobacillus kofuensis]